MHALDHLRQRWPDGIALLDSIALLRSADGAVDVLAPDPFRIRGAGRAPCELLEKLKVGASWSELVHAFEDPHGRALVVELDRRGLLGPRLSVEAQAGPLGSQLFWLAHLSAAPHDLQGRLTAQRALVLGCGGTGAIVVQHLAALGVGTLALVDCDVVEPSNLNRQFPYRRIDVGRPKAEALREHVLERHPDCRVRAVRARIASTADLLDIASEDAPTVIFCCADLPVGHIAAFTAEACLALGAVGVFGSVGVRDGAIGPLLHTQGALRAYAADLETVGRASADAIGRVAARSSFAPVNTVISAMLVYQWSKHVLESGPCAIDGRELVLDMDTLSARSGREWT